MSQNHWNYEQELSNIGGILGLSLGTYSWYGEVKKVTVALGVDHSYDWYYAMKGQFKPFLVWSELLVNESIPAERSKGTAKVSVKSTSDKFRFLSDRVNFGSTSLVKPKNKVVELSMGLSGLGFPQADYFNVAEELYSIDESIVCPGTNGGSCHSHLACADLYTEFKDAFLDLHLLGSSYAFKMPLTTLLSQQEDKCQILVSNLGIDSAQSQYIVLGSTFL
jgi:hypothetical protein